MGLPEKQETDTFQIKMISDEKCKQILNGGDQQYTKEEIDKIKKVLLHLAKLEVVQFKKQRHYENSRDHEQSLNGRASEDWI